MRRGRCRARARHRTDDRDDRIVALTVRARGFVYVASVSGVTGEGAVLDARVAARIGRARRTSTVPVALGFGISTAEAATAGADGVIVGSRLVRAAMEAADPPAAVRDLVGRFSTALRGCSRLVATPRLGDGRRVAAYFSSRVSCATSGA